MKAREHNPEGTSQASEIMVSPAKREKLLRSLTDAEARLLLHDWDFWARPKQQAPVWRWFVWMILAGRGFGKTLTAAQYVRSQVETKKARRIAIMGPTVGDVRDVMIEGVSGILDAFPDNKRPEYVPSKRLIRFHTGAIARTYTAEEPERLRGDNHDMAWLDEPAAYRYLEDIWKLLVPNLRYGDNPRVVMTTTPKPLPRLHALLDSEKTAYTTGSTYENASNLPPETLEQIEAIYKGTDLGAQEIGGVLLGESPGALWRFEWIASSRVDRIPCDVLKKIIIIDPSSSAKDEACEVGMMVLYFGVDKKVYVVEDLSCRASPADWIAKAALARKKHNASAIYYESNHGGGFIVALFSVSAKDEVRYLKPIHASDSKAARALPVSALTQKGFVRMVGRHTALEAQLTTWIPGKGKSPDRLDALVHGVTELAIGPVSPTGTRIKIAGFM